MFSLGLEKRELVEASEKEKSSDDKTRRIAERYRYLEEGSGKKEGRGRQKLEYLSQIMNE